MIKKFIQKLFDIHPDAMSFRETMDLTGLPICTFYQGDKKLNFILDTGTDVNVIDSNVLDDIEHTMKDTNGVLYGIEGKRVTTKVCSIALTYKDRTLSGFYLIRDMKEAFGNMKKDHGVNLHGLLGSKFFNDYKYVLDFDSLVAYSKK